MKLKSIVFGIVIATSMLSAVKPAYAEVNMASVTNSLGKYSKPIENRLNAAPDALQDNWNVYSESIKIANIESASKTAYYSYTDGIFINLEADATSSLKVQCKPKYADFFHEVGHNIGNTLSDAFTAEKGSCISYTYKSKKYNCTLNDMLYMEGNAYFEQVRKKVKTDKRAWKKIDRELKSYNMYHSYEVSDIWDGISKGKAKGYCGHTISVNGKKYWDSYTVGCEAFANMYEASITNPKGVTLIKKYFPKSYEIFIEELNLRPSEEEVSDASIVK